MRILVMGGTWFLGKQIVQQALARGWDVTTFNRGRSGADVPGVQAVRGDRTVADDLSRLASSGPWDAVVDTSSSEMPPRDVLRAVRALRKRARRWVHVSTVSVYQGWPHQPITETSPVLDCPPDADESFGWTGADGSPTAYGFQKAGAERAVQQAFGDSCVLLRPGAILGPEEYVGRLPWWLARTARGGRVLAPAPAERHIQPVDVRDVARFAVDQAAATSAGAYNITHPEGITFQGFLDACFTVTRGPGRPVWAEPGLLSEHAVKQWTELPLWRAHKGVWAVDSTRAAGDGLRCRPLVETIADTWAWLQDDGRPVDHPRWAEHGIDPDKEAKILAALG
ncbi:NAD-dependent epimerase/dehydratase family protein [Streptomyces poriferorum]|uniref:NAD-dependent epimerase/dehydratase family protein n=1 Tax=Streptomyces poriferorum TaxID=2798799 RepID=A0ABY9J325_9ACTN|nr:MULTISPECIES: NAD-dependent epimerase/dehydratase family protein [unclassified Streptomyces]MDP5317352.1 NAD-dependent epimerase/dehydratase family protein [Streptomyces sp. Alt4]WLQ62042.1 NAD-dependent epimerase/dehydratase family protein [Streptomyces sp. Alt2]